MEKKKSGSRVVLALAGIATVVFLLARSAAVECVYPIERAVRGAVRYLDTLSAGVFNGIGAAQENARLRREAAALALVRSDLERLETENARLRRALGYLAREPETWLAATVLSERGGAAKAAHTLRVDRGTADGVRAGAVVASPDGLVGIVRAATVHTAEILLVTDPSVRVACAVEDSEGRPPARGILSGGSPDQLVLRYFSGPADVPPRARVMTSGLGGVFPKGLVVGTLLGVRQDAERLVREGDVLPSVDFTDLEDVFIRREK